MSGTSARTDLSITLDILSKQLIRTREAGAHTNLGSDWFIDPDTSTLCLIYKAVTSKREPLVAAWSLTSAIQEIPL